MHAFPPFSLLHGVRRTHSQECMGINEAERKRGGGEEKYLSHVSYSSPAAEGREGRRERRRRRAFISP